MTSDQFAEALACARLEDVVAEDFEGTHRSGYYTYITLRVGDTYWGCEINHKIGIGEIYGIPEELECIGTETKTNLLFQLKNRK